jgi:type VI secretion system secreted protein VgrG
MPDNTAQGPIMKLQTSLGDTLRFRSLAASEEMGRLYDYSVLALADADANVDPVALLGTDAVVSIELGNGEQRHFHGQVARAGLESAHGKLISWRLQLRPWLWRLTRRADNRIFQNLTVEDIIKKVFEKHPGGDVVFELQGSFTPRLYCVQYRESDFNFVSRLMEEEGMYYFHRHTADKHTLVICNAMTSHADFPGFGSIKYRDSQDQLIDLQAITEWRHANELTTGKVTLTDYDYLKPGTSLMVDHSSVHNSAPAALENYDYPGLYLEKARGSNLAQVRQQERDARVLRVTGSTTTVGGLAAGYRFALVDHQLASENTDHVVISTHIDAQYAGYESGQGENHFVCRFTAMRYAHVFRPDRITPKPLISGPQTAVVVGPSGEEIYTDAHARVKVQFHWDRLGEKNDGSSCWVRVASQWAGKAWGMISLPRIGQEVVVDFLEGDPDLPLITGRVYNAVQVPPYALPDNKTVSTIRSQSTLNGTTANANELRFEDKKGEEYVWFQAEKDMRHLVKNNSQTWIKANESRLVGGNLTEQVSGKHSDTVVGNHEFLVKGEQKIHVNGEARFECASPYTLWTTDWVIKNSKVKWKCDELQIEDDGDFKLKASTIHLKAGSVILEGTSKISLKVGGNFVVISASGVDIKGAMVKINSGGSGEAADAAEGEQPVSMEAPAKPAQLNDPLTPAA